MTTVTLHRVPESSRPNRRRRPTIRWSIVVPLMALTWGLMAYAIYYLVGSARY